MILLRRKGDWEGEKRTRPYLVMDEYKNLCVMEVVSRYELISCIDLVAPVVIY